jgi:uncharacterized protein (DUF885 family)
MVVTDRRAVLMGGAAAVAVTALPAMADAQAQASPLAPIFDDLVQAQLRRGPEGATNLGLDTGANADLRSKLSDQSPAAVAANKAANLAELKRLEAVDAAALTPDQRIDLQCVLYTRRSAARVGAFDFGGSGYGPALMSFRNSRARTSRCPISSTPSTGSIARATRTPICGACRPLPGRSPTRPRGCGATSATRWCRPTSSSTWR